MILDRKAHLFIDLQSEILLLNGLKILIHISLVYLELNLLYRAELHEAEMDFIYQEAFAEKFRMMFSGGYALILLYPIYQFLKVTIIAAIIHIGFSCYKVSFSFKRIIWIVSICELILLIPFAYKIFYFSYLHPEDYLRVHFLNFSFGTLLNVVDTEYLNKALFFVLQAINIWDLSYLLVAGYLVKKYQDLSFDFAFKIVGNSYGICYLSFIVFGYLFLAS
jgi:hypothetical protein